MSTIRCLLLGDVVGKAGCALFQKWVPKLREQYQADVVVVNGENSHDSGRGIIPRSVNFFRHNGADVITTGNHIWKHKDIYQTMQERDDIIRPANFPPGCPGKGYTFVRKGEVTIAIVNLQGRVFMHENLDCPFRAIESLLPFLRARTPLIFVDMHAETTSEKQAMAFFLDGRVSGVVGTHTHVPTADEKILPKGTAYVSDLGYAGSYYSMLGMEPGPIIARYLTQMPAKFEVATSGPLVMSGVLITADAATGYAQAIERLQVIDNELAATL